MFQFQTEKYMPHYMYVSNQERKGNHDTRILQDFKKNASTM